MSSNAAGVAVAHESVHLAECVQNPSGLEPDHRGPPTLHERRVGGPASGLSHARRIPRPRCGEHSSRLSERDGWSGFGALGPRQQAPAQPAGRFVHQALGQVVPSEVELSGADRRFDQGQGKQIALGVTAAEPVGGIPHRLDLVDRFRVAAPGERLESPTVTVQSPLLG